MYTFYAKIDHHKLIYKNYFGLVSSKADFNS